MEFLYNNFIGEALLYVLRWFYSFLNDYAWAIILVTILIKVVLLPLDLKQRASSAKMAAVSSQVEDIKKRYANNQELANKKVNEFYQKNKIKPSAGCLPMLLTMIFLFAFYGALRTIVTEQTISLLLEGVKNGAENVDLPNWLWIHNIFQPDAGHQPIFPTAQNFMTFIQTNSASINPQMFNLMRDANLLTFADGAMTVNETVYNTLTTEIIAANGLTGFNNGWFGLPIIAGGTLFLQQFITSKTNPTMNNQPGGKMMMYFFPIFSAYICLTTNACFALYWTMSNVVGIVVHLVYTAIQKAKKNREPVTIDSIR